MVHTPVMTAEVMRFLLHEQSRLIVDATVGAGGHAKAILRASRQVQIIGIDRDPDALREAHKALHQFAERIRLVKANYSDIGQFLSPEEKPDGVLLDLGLSSLQIDTGRRGFSHSKDGPLDMRMSREGITAKTLIETSEVDALARILREYGEVDRSRRIAKQIIDAADRGEMDSTQDLREAITASVRGTAPVALLSKVFQAIRIAINDELGSLKRFLASIVGHLNRNAAIVVISYHSLEDRLVKEFFRRESRVCICPPGTPVCTCGHHALLQVLTRRVVKPSAKEVALNPRARSAKLRAARVLAGGEGS